MQQRLTYFSARAPEFNSVAALVSRSAESNNKLGVTGLLIADRSTFLQVLEGPRDLVSTLFVKISCDPRHTRLVIASVEDIAEQSYPAWGMAQIDDVSRIANMWWRIASDRTFDPWTMSAREIADFLRLASFELMKLRTAS